MYKFELSIIERAVIQYLRPQMGDYLTNKIFDDIIKLVEFSVEEIKDFGIKYDKTGFSYDSEKVGDKVFKYEFTEDQYNKICDELKQRDKDRKLFNSMTSLYKKFIYFNENNDGK